MMDIHQDKMKILVVIFSKNEKILHIKDNLQELNYEGWIYNLSATAPRQPN